MQILASETIKTNSIFYFYFFSVVGEGDKGRERGKIKNNKERIFKWNGKKIEVLILMICLVHWMRFTIGIVIFITRNKMCCNVIIKPIH